MNLVELDHALRKLRLSGMAAVLETRLRHAQTEKLTPIDLVSALVSDELLRRQDRLLERRHKQAGFRDPHPSLDNFDFDFNKKMNRALIHELATGRFIAQREDALFLGPPGTGKSHLAQAIGRAVIQQGYRVRYREAHIAPRGDRRRDAGRHPQSLFRGSGHGPAPDRRRPRDAETPTHGRRRPPRSRHASLRARLDALDVKPTRR